MHFRVASQQVRGGNFRGFLLDVFTRLSKTRSVDHPQMLVHQSLGGEAFWSLFYSWTFGEFWHSYQFEPPRIAS